MSQQQWGLVRPNSLVQQFRYGVFTPYMSGLESARLKAQTLPCNEEEKGMARQKRRLRLEPKIVLEACDP